MRVRVKICGVTTPEDAAFAIDAGADAVGLNFYSGSPRYLTDEAADCIVRALPPFSPAVGVFVDAADDAIRHAVLRYSLSGVQTYQPVQPGASFAPSAHIPAFRVKDEFDLEAVRRVVESSHPQAVLLDSSVPGAFGGTGHRAPWHLLAGFDPGVPVILAGGLTPDTVGEAIEVVRPWGVDVASGVESAPRRKDHDKVTAFVRAVRAAGC